jgi:hypothetical protein
LVSSRRIWWPDNDRPADGGSRGGFVHDKQQPGDVDVSRQHVVTAQSGRTVLEAVDGSIGKVDDATNDVGQSFIVVDTGPWIFGKKVMLPAGVISRVDLDTETVFVNRTKDQIKSAPEYDEDNRDDEAYRDRYREDLGGYYGRGGAGYRDDDLI